MSHTRYPALQAWVREQIPGRSLEWTPISSDASFRRYYRVTHQTRSWVVMDAPPEREPVAPFMDVASRLAASGIHVPDILAADVWAGFLLLSDLGDQTYLEALTPRTAKPMFYVARAAACRMQRHTSASGLPEYDAALLRSELELFRRWFLARHWRVRPTDNELEDWDRVCKLLIRWALDQPQVFVHRDFMPRNLICHAQGPGVLDFQDAVLGPISYDAVCLYRDAFVSWPPGMVDRWLEHHRQMALDGPLPLPVPQDRDLWRRTCDLMSVQRHLKVIGIFARIAYRDHKPRYLADTPRFFTYLDQAIARNPELVGLGRLLARWRERRHEATCTP